MKCEKIKKILGSSAGKSLILLLVAALIGVAVYANYQLFYDPVGSMGYGDNNMSDNADGSQSAGNNANEEDYFTSVALNRQQSRDEAIDVLKMVSESEEASAEARAEATAKIAKIATDVQNEANIETLVKAKGFEDCVAVISDNSVSVIVSAESLQASEAAQIFAIVYDTTGIGVENISIINR